MSVLDPTADEILEFWFDTAGPKRGYTVDAAFDAVVRRRFARAVERHAATLRGGDHPWLGDPGSALALILLLDQFPRNIWRGSGRAFAYDAQAREVSLDMIERGFDWAVRADRRDFVYMPFMHSEDLADQDLCVELAENRLEQDSTLRHARMHREVIERFGRFPYRNDALGRGTTQDEAEYLTSGGYAPGRKDSAKSS